MLMTRLYTWKHKDVSVFILFRKCVVRVLSPIGRHHSPKYHIIIIILFKFPTSYTPILHAGLLAEIYFIIVRQRVLPYCTYRNTTLARFPPTMYISLLNIILQVRIIAFGPRSLHSDFIITHAIIIVLCSTSSVYS